MDESKCYGLHSKKDYELEPTNVKATLLYAFTLLGIGLTVGIVVISLFNWILPL